MRSPSEASEASEAPAGAAERAARKAKRNPAGPQRHRLTRAEVRLLAETYREHKHLKWAAQVAIYNAAARERGWFDQVKVTTYTTRCNALRQELEFKADAGAGRLCQKWRAFEDEELARWDWRGRMRTRYPAFIEHMRAAFEPSYFRSVMAISSRLAILGVSVQRAAVKGEGEEDEEKMEEQEEDEEDEEKMEEQEEDEEGEAEEQHASSIVSDSAEHHKRSGLPLGLKQRHRMCKDEMRLVAETYREHKHKTWAAQVAIYNAAARERGWYDQVKVATYTTRCNALRQEQQFKSDAGANATRLRWAAYEDEVLTKWDWCENVAARYPAFIEHMRAAFDPDYFRSVMAVTSRLAVLGVASPQTATKAEAADVAMEEEGGVDRQVIASARASPPAAMQDQARQTTASPPSVVVDGASSPDEADVHSGGGRPDIVPAVVPILAQERVERKLLNIQRLLRTADAALFGGSSPTSYTLALQDLHNRLQDLISDAIVSVTRSPSERGISSTNDERAAFTDIQSKAILSILTAKVDAAEARAHALEEEHTQYCDWADEHITRLRSKCLEVEAVKVELQKELHKCQVELARQAAAGGTSPAVAEDSKLAPDFNEPAASASLPLESKDTSVHASTHRGDHELYRAEDVAEPNHEPPVNEVSQDGRGTRTTDATSDKKRPSAPFSSLSDRFFEPNRPGPSVQQQQLAYLLASANHVIDLT